MQDRSQDRRKQPASLLLVGMQRSGTTCLAQHLAEHPRLYMTINGKLLYYLIVWVYRDPCFDQGDHIRFDEIVHGQMRKPIWGVPPAHIVHMRQRLQEAFPPGCFAGMSRQEAVRTIWYRTMGELAGDGPMVGDKYNEYLLQMDELAEVLPEARYVFLHRHPADVAESMLRAFAGRPWCPADLAAALRKWTTWNRRWLAARARIPEAQRIELAYEDLVAAPERAIATLCERLGLACEPAYLAAARARLRADRVGRGRALRPDWRDQAASIPGLPETMHALGYSLEAEV